jgi:hypothetical protein
LNDDLDLSTREFDIVEPAASPILESLRAFGYRPETAIADLVDNSISAKAKKVEIDFHWAGRDSWVRIADDGIGMPSDKLQAAMRLGSKSPVEERANGDLGRYGLGLKTAAFSQGRRLSVLSRAAGHESQGRTWDLDLVQKTNQWRLIRGVPQDVTEPMESKLAPRGTVILLSGLDRMLGLSDSESQPASSKPQFLEIAESVARHLELVFHRFLTGPRPLQLFLNSRRLVGWDPFLESSGSINLGREEIPFAGASVSITGYVLPHKSKLSAAAYDAAAGIGGWNSNQGFYVYRDNRLLVHGTWLGVAGAKEEHSKLARVSLEIPSRLDHLWQVDVRKSSIRPPSAIQADLRRVALATKRQAQEVYRFRGKATLGRLSQEYVIAWVSERLRDGGTRYKINRAHPLIEDARTGNGVDHKGVERLLRFVEETLPVAQIAIAISDSVETEATQMRADLEDIRDQLEYLYSRQVARGKTPTDALKYILSAEPFIYYPEIVEAFKDGLK